MLLLIVCAARLSAHVCIRKGQTEDAKVDMGWDATLLLTHRTMPAFWCLVDILLRYCRQLIKLQQPLVRTA